MIELTEIYKETKFLDELFAKESNIDGEEMLKKNILELLVEIGELANETRCFKYWSKKQPSDKEIILEEYIDCLSMVLYFSNITGINLTEEFPKEEHLDIIQTFIKLYHNTSLLNEELNKDRVKRILVDIMYLGKLLGFNIEDLERVTKKKSLIIQKRFKENY